MWGIYESVESIRRVCVADEHWHKRIIPRTKPNGLFICCCSLIGFGRLLLLMQFVPHNLTDPHSDSFLFLSLSCLPCRKLWYGWRSLYGSSVVGRVCAVRIAAAHTHNTHIWRTDGWIGVARFIFFDIILLGIVRRSLIAWIYDGCCICASSVCGDVMSHREPDTQSSGSVWRTIILWRGRIAWPSYMSHGCCSCVCFACLTSASRVCSGFLWLFICRPRLHDFRLNCCICKRADCSSWRCKPATRRGNKWLASGQMGIVCADSISEG